MSIKDVLFNRLSGNFLSVFLGVVVLSLSTYINGPSYGFIDGYGIMAVGLFVMFAWVIRLHAYYEAQRIANKIIINHGERFIRRSIVALVASFLIHVLAEGYSLHMIKVTLMGAFFIGGTFWLLFDSFLSNDRNLPILYVSSWYKSSKIDKYFSKINSPLLWVLSKIILFLLTGYLYVKSF